MGCIGAWTVKELLRDGCRVVAADLSTDPYRLGMILRENELAEIAIAKVDVGTGDGLEEVIDAHGVRRVIHLAALQLPFCKRDPVRGALVNVAGTIRVFEAVKARRHQIDGLAYASSIAVYGAPDDYEEATPAENAPQSPHSFYGAYKAANEQAARVAWEEYELPSVGLRPYTVYGVGRDQGMTSTPSQAMAAAAEGRSFHIAFGGACVYSHARDVARAFVMASERASSGAVVCNVPGPVASMSEIVSEIERNAPAVAGRITFEDVPLPFPAMMRSTFDERIGRLSYASIREGIAETIQAFRDIAKTEADRKPGRVSR
jgi:nucleoside-diphosphate-sugar epimerase